MENRQSELASEYFRQGEYLLALKCYLRLEREFGRGSFAQGIALCTTELDPNRREDRQADDEVGRMPVSKLYERVRTNKGNFGSVADGPLVSVVVTAHNTEEYVESCVDSLLSQTYKNIEIIVVSDASTDGTDDILYRLRKAYRRVSAYRLSANLGTYYAKNLGIQKAAGEYVFFQDSDDVSHHQRIAFGMGLFMKHPDALVVRGAYSRVDPETESVVRVNDTTSKLGLITLGIKKQVFENIGYFNCTTKASDDELFNRIKSVYGTGVIKNFDLPLYFNTMREGSLFADMVSWRGDHNLSQTVSASRKDYVEVFTGVHKASDAAALNQRFAFPRIRDAVTVRSDMTKLPNPEIPVVMSVCSIPSRARGLRTVIEALAPQVDRICVYLDGYEDTPDFLKDRADVSVTHSQEKPGLRDNGKFLELEKLLEANEDAYYITVDDDIYYPVDYVAHLLKKLNEYQDRVVVGTHGVVLPKWPRGYFAENRIVYKFAKALESDKGVNILGTGTTAFRVSSVQGFDLREMPHSGMADLYWAAFCKNHAVPMICVERHAGWLQEMSFSGENLFQEFMQDDPKQSELVMSAAPWSHDVIKDSLDSKIDDVDVISKLVPGLRFHQRLMD